MIATPSHDGTVCCDYAVAMAEIFRQAQGRRYALNLEFWMLESLVQKARNNLLAKAHRQGFDEMVWIDADQGFTADAFFQLLSHPVDAVALPVRMKTDEPRFNIRPENPREHKWDNDLGLLEVKGIGTGFLRLTKRAIQVLWDAGTPYNEDGEERRMVCNLEIRGGGLISEDIQICERLQEAGIKIYADVSTTCDHFGVKKFSGDYLSAIERDAATEQTTQRPDNATGRQHGYD